MFCDVEEKAVIPAITLDSIYKVPLYFEKHNLSEVILNKFGLKYKSPNMKQWENYVSLM
jgi:CTP synthase